MNTRTLAPSIVLLAALLLSAIAPALAADGVPTVVVDRSMGRWFGSYTGCLLLHDLSRNMLVKVNPEQCARRASPCSTFKIWNSLVGLETGVLQDENTTFAWDGTKYEIKEWNHDQTLASAVRNSVVWYFQKVAAGIGQDRMSYWINRVPYGNRDTSGGLTNFWLQSSLLISPDEQLYFLQQLYGDRLPFRPEVVATVKKVLVVEKTDAYELSGKTGSGRKTADRPAIGWFVGHLKSTRGEYLFVVEIEGDHAWGPEAKRIALDILKDRRLLE